MQGVEIHDLHSLGYLSFDMKDVLHYYGKLIATDAPDHVTKLNRELGLEP